MWETDHILVTENPPTITLKSHWIEMCMFKCLHSVLNRVAVWWMVPRTNKDPESLIHVTIYELAAKNKTDYIFFKVITVCFSGKWPGSV